MCDDGVLLACLGDVRTNELDVLDRKSKSGMCADAIHVGDVESQLEIERIVRLIQKQENEIEMGEQGGWKIEVFRRHSLTFVAPIRRIGCCEH